jgi:hypothetical protein
MLKNPAAPSDLAAVERDIDRLMSPDARRETGLVGGFPGHGAAVAPTVPGSLLGSGDSVLMQVAGEIRDDPDALGLLLHGSRAIGTARPDSSYDLIAILNHAAYAQRKERGSLEERRVSRGCPMVAITYESLGRLRHSAHRGGVRAAMVATSIVLVDKGGDINPLVTASVAAREPAHERVSREYDGYLNGFTHSLKSSMRGDDLGARAHAAEGGLHLLRALFALEGKSPPHLDQLSFPLSELENALGFRRGFLRGALLRLFYAPDPPFQQMLDRRVSRLMDSRGIRHTWRHDLEQVRRLKYDEL